MRSSLMTSAALAAALAFAAPAMAQTNAPAPGEKPAAENAMEQSAQPAPEAADIAPEDLAGLPVHDSAGEEVGEVSDVKTGPDGKIERLIVSQGGFLGMGAKKIAVEGTKAELEGDRVVLDLTGSQVSELPDYEDPGEAGDQPPGGPGAPGVGAPLATGGGPAPAEAGN